jgi:hypothetical protein
LKVRYGLATIYRDKDTEIPDDAFDFAFLGSDEKQAFIIYMLPSTPDDIMKVRVNEIVHHLHGMKQGGYK